MSNKRKIKRSWRKPGDPWKKTGDEITAKIDKAISSDVQQVMVNSQELVLAFKANLSFLAQMSAMVDDSDEQMLEMFMLRYNGAIMGMVNLLGTVGVYSEDKAREILDLFFYPPEGADE